MAIGRSALRSSSRSTPKCIMGYIIWDVFGSHFVFFKKRWEFPVIIRLVNTQLSLYSHVRCNLLSTPQNTPQMTVTNFNYEGSYLPGVICNIVVKADLGRSPGRSTPPTPLNWHLVVKNGNFTLLLTSSGQEWQLADLPPQMHHGIYIIGCIWQPFWILQENMGISFYFWTIRVVNSQLALYSHVM